MEESESNHHMKLRDKKLNKQQNGNLSTSLRVWFRNTDGGMERGGDWRGGGLRRHG